MIFVYGILGSWALYAVGLGIYSGLYCPKFGNRTPFNVENFKLGLFMGVLAPVLYPIFTVKDLLVKRSKKVAKSV